MEEAIAAMEGFNMEDTPIPSTTKSQLWGDITDPRCETCGKVFKRRSELNRHKNIHIGPSYGCHFSQCKKQFTQKQTLVIHLRAHTGEKPHTYDQCGKQMANSSALAKHRRSHSGTKPHSCPYKSYQERFTRKTGLTMHLRTQHQCQEVDVRENGKTAAAAEFDFSAPVSTT